MSSIRTDPVAVDANEYVFAIRGSAEFPACARLLRRLPQLSIVMPLQTLHELHRNLYPEEVDQVFVLLKEARELTRDFMPADQAVVETFLGMGARPGDARLIAQLVSAQIGWLISENRHFLTELPNLPFRVANAEQALRLLDEDS